MARSKGSKKARGGSAPSAGRKGQKGKKQQKEQKGLKGQKATQRIVNSKRHTVGYVVGGRSYNLTKDADRSTLLSMGRHGGISGVRVVGNHLQARPGGRRLSTLPTSIQRS